MAARIRARLAQEDGYTLIELLTSMAILAFVLTAILGVFVSGLNAEVDMNNRFQAQQNARLALTSMRIDIRNACVDPSVSLNGVPVAAGSLGDTVTLGFCSSSSGWSSSAVSSVTWCTRNEGGNPVHYGLYRESGSTCTAGVREADWLTTGSVFTYLAAASGLRPQLQVNLPVDATPSTSGVGVYTLSDTIMLRNVQPS